MTIRITGDLDLRCYIDADFCRLHKPDPTDKSINMSSSLTCYVLLPEEADQHD